MTPGNPHVAIAIDGPAASGKSTLARILAQQLGLIMVNSGAMYRAITWKVLKEGRNPHDAQAVIEVLRATNLECGDDGVVSTIKIDGIDPGDELRSEEVNANVSAVAAVPEVRETLVALQRGYLQRTSVVMEGRDIGSVVFPDTPYKIYVDADEQVRAARRRDAGELDAVSQRDAADSSRATAPLTIAEGATVLDTSHHTIESGVEAAIEILKKQGLNPVRC
jgi:cytidylate kinase